MLDDESIPEVHDEELLARFIVNKNEYRKSDNKINLKLFMPYRHVALSVNRHRESNEQEIWGIGSQVAKARNKTLYGRADILAASCRIESLDVNSKPLPGNPNHADIIGYPVKREDQMSLAQKLAAAAGNRIAPPSQEIA